MEPVPGSEVRTFLIADVRGYTSFTLEHGDEAAAQLATRFADLVEEVVAARDGTVIELRGDEALAVFTSARQGLRAATELQTRLDRERKLNPSLPLEVGVGLDAGEAIAIRGGYRGTALNLAARLCALAGPGEVLISDGIVHLARKVDGLDYNERGMAQIKGFIDPVRILSVIPSLSDFPEARSSGAAGRRPLTSEAVIDYSPPNEGPAPGTQEGTAGQPFPIGGFLGSLPDGVLVAREEELRQVMTTVDAVAGGTGRLVLLAGEPGVGKTRLAQEGTLHLRNRGFLLAAGRCYETHQDIPFYPFLDALAALYGTAPATVRAEVPRRWPLLAQLLPEENLIPAPGSTGGREEQERLFRAVGGFINALATGTGVALLLDDLHWADSTSLDLLLHLARQTRAHRVLLLGTYRDVEVNRRHPLGKALRDMGREHLADEIAVRRLDRGGTAALMSVAMDAPSIPDALADLVHRRTEGNPFFIEEILHTLVERGDVFQEDGQWKQRDVTEIEMPRSVRDAIGDRLTRLSETAQDVLQEASVLGQTFSFDDLLSIAEIGERELEEILEEVIGAQLVRERSRDTYAFDHALTQQTLYAELSNRRKRRLHRAAAEALEQLPERQRDRRTAEIARHFQQADDLERALPYTLQAGGQSEAVFAHSEAERQYRLALELAQDTGDAAGEATALERLGWVLQTTAHLREARDVFERAVAIYRSVGDLDGEARVTAHVAWLLADNDEPDEVLARVRPLLPDMERRAPSRTLAELYLVLTSALVHVGRFEDALESLPRAAEIARELGDTALIAAVEGRRGFVLAAKGDTRAALPVLEHTLALAEAEGDLETQSRALKNFASAGGDQETTIAYARRALKEAERRNDPKWLSLPIEIMIQFGFTDEARRHAERGLAQAREAGMSDTSLYPLLQLLGEAARIQGDWEASRRYLEETVRLADQGGSLDTKRWAILNLAWQDIWEGRPDAALALLEPERDALDEWGMGPAALRAEAYLRMGDLEQAEQILTESLDRHAGEELVGERLVLRVRGMVFARQRRWDEAEQSFEDALAQTRTMRVAEFEAHILFDYGLLYRDMGKSEEARERLEAALALFRRMGAKSFAERTEQALSVLS